MQELRSIFFDVFIGMPSNCHKSDRCRWKRVTQCEKRCQARQYCRNHYWKNGGLPLRIIHSNGIVEDYVHN